jgi:hypothetical protein
MARRSGPTPKWGFTDCLFLSFFFFFTFFFGNLLKGLRCMRMDHLLFIGACFELSIF